MYETCAVFFAAWHGSRQRKEWEGLSHTWSESLLFALVHQTIPFMMMMMTTTTTTKMPMMMIVMVIVVVMINVLCLLPSYVAVSDPVCGPWWPGAPPSLPLLSGGCVAEAAGSFLRQDPCNCRGSRTEGAGPVCTQHTLDGLWGEGASHCTYVRMYIR